MFLGLVAVCLHALLLHQWIDISSGQNLNFFNLLSLAVWLVAVLLLVMALFRSVEVLVLFLFPVSAISILLVLRFPEAEIIQTTSSPDALFHILLSVVTFCVLSVAGLLAILLAFQDSLLRRRQSSIFIEKLPPLETLEQLLFQVNGLGFILLSALITTSLYFYYDLLWVSAALLQKTLLAATAWIIFAVLLWGRFVWGWRGRKAIYGTLIGVVLLFLAYFGSKILLRALH
ncbi:MAG: cytochrome c biogenesis protein CcsA [Coxiellaceae bacterium]|nr:cytochrome c biogenesis protein CcsA [Coxiellaceae bacterium]